MPVKPIAMPLWYIWDVSRITAPDLNGKISAYKIPVWNKGDTAVCFRGGTETGRPTSLPTRTWQGNSGIRKLSEEVPLISGKNRFRPNQALG